MQRVRQRRDAAQGKIAPTPLDIGNIGAVHVGPPRQLFLGNAKSVTVFFYGRPKFGFEIRSLG